MTYAPPMLLVEKAKVANRMALNPFLLYTQINTGVQIIFVSTRRCGGR